MQGEAPASIEAAAEWLRKHFAPERARGVSVVYELDLTGPAGGLLQVRIDDGRLELGRGRATQSDVRFRLSAADWFGILAGRENAELLFMAGRIQVDGDRALAVKMGSYFARRV